MTTTPIDPTKIRPGDEVELHKAQVVEKTIGGITVRWETQEGFTQAWLSFECIATHTPKPREFKPGDRAFHENTSPQMTFEIIAVDKGVAWVRYARGHRAEWELHKLRHADEGADR